MGTLLYKMLLVSKFILSRYEIIDIYLSTIVCIDSILFSPVKKSNVNLVQFTLLLKEMGNR